MKILTLNLEAFGPFTDLVLDLSSGSEGLHLIYGDNEAGKSSALRALRGLLFGIPMRSTDDFRHQYKDLRIGARIRHSDGSELDFVRQKARKNSLRDPGGKALADTALVNYLAGVDEDLFSTLYGISHQELVQGGQDILAAKGDVGQSLFDAGMGGISLRRVIESLDADAGELFKTRGKQRIATLVEQFKEIRLERKAWSLSSREWVEHDAALEAARKEKEDVIKELGKLRNRQERLERIRKSLPLIATRETILGELGELAAATVLRDGFPEERREALRTLKDAQRTETKTQASLEGIQGEIQGLTVQDELLQQGEAIAELHERLGSHRKAAEDLVTLQSQRTQLTSQAQAVLKELKPRSILEEAESLRLPAARKTRIRELGNRHESLVSMLQRNEEDVRHIESDLDRSAAELADLEDAKDTADLELAVGQTRKAGDLDDQLAQACSDLRGEEEQSKIDLGKLGLWSGTLEQLEALPVPASEMIDRYDSQYADLASRRKGLSDQIGRAKQRIKDFDRQIDDLQHAGPVPTDTDLDEARKRRDEGWRLVRRAWLDGQRDSDLEREFDPDHELPEAYERSVAQADDVVDRVRRDADRVAEYKTLGQRRAEAEEEIRGWTRQRQDLETEQADLDKQWCNEWSFLAGVPRPPKEMRSWIQKQGRLTEQARQTRVARHEIGRIEQVIEDRRSQLADCLGRLGMPEPESAENIEDLLVHCESVLGDLREVRQRRKDLERSIADLQTSRDQAIQKRTDARAALEKWQAEWEPAMAELGLTGEGTPNQANAVLDMLQELFDKLEDAENLRIRIGGIRKDADQFKADVEAMVREVAPNLVDLPADRAASQLTARLNQAREDKVAIDKLRKQEKEKQENLREAQATIKEMQAQLDNLCEEASCAMDELEEVEKRSARKCELQSRFHELDERLLGLGDGLAVDQIIQEPDDLDQDELPTQLLEVEDAIGNLDRMRSQLDQTIGSEETVLRGMDGSSKAAEAEQKAQSLLAEIQEGAERFVRLRLAATILRQQIERYREQNQDPVLRRASELFARLTLKSFAGLQTDFDDRDEPVLGGVRPSGETVSVEGMSDGTRDPLYLCLRLASLERNLEQNEPIPFIVDDVLISFDDHRARAALAVLAELSRKTQVICFTHHARLVALAEDAVDGGVLHVHSLGQMPHL